MAEVVRMPKMSDTMTDGVLAKWHKKVGDKVKPGDVLAEVETDKATMDFESYQEGTLLFIGVPEGQSVPVDAIIAVLGSEGEDYKTALGESSPEPVKATEQPVETTEEAEPEQPVEAIHEAEPKTEEQPVEAPKEPGPKTEEPVVAKAPEPVEDKKPEPAPQAKVDTSKIPATVIRMPALSDTMTEGVINKWNFKVGDKVKADDSLADVETDKATMEVVGYEEGTLLYIGPKEGEAAPVNGIIAIVGKAGTDITPLLKEAGIAVEETGEDKPLAEPDKVPFPLAEEVAPTGETSTPVQAPVASAPVEEPVAVIEPKVTASAPVEEPAPAIEPELLLKVPNLLKGREAKQNIQLPTIAVSKHRRLPAGLRG
jgi:pyruvate dehydrogenase E2 component (dihydrolipoamide acetyltransferase)